MARDRALSEKNMIDAIWISIVAGFIGAHAVHVIFYEQNLSSIGKFLELSKGISSTGGFLVGGIAAWLYFRWKKLPVLNYGDCMVAGVLLALFFGRLGCFTAHDHPGNLTSMPWGVRFPDGVRHDLGFEEAVLLGIFWIVVSIKSNWKRLNATPGNWMVVALMFYGCIRAALDNMRAEDLPISDPRYFGHTFAQYVCAIFVILATIIYKHRGTGSGT